MSACLIAPWVGVPSGASTGIFEALRDKDANRYLGKGVLGGTQREHNDPRCAYW